MKGARRSPDLLQSVHADGLSICNFDVAVLAVGLLASRIVYAESFS